MVYAVRAEIAFSTPQRRNQARTQIDNYLAAHPDRFDANVPINAPLDAGPNGIALDLRFRQRADADQLITSFAGLSQIVGGYYVAHDCPHDVSPPLPCPDPVRVLLPL